VIRQRPDVEGILRSSGGSKSFHAPVPSGACCGQTVPPNSEICVTCSGDDDTDGYNDVFYKFSVRNTNEAYLLTLPSGTQSFEDLEFPDLRVSTTRSDFPTTISMQYLNKEQPTPIWSVYNGIVHETSSGKKWLTIPGEKIRSWALQSNVTGTTFAFVDFKLKISETNANSTGSFKVHVFTKPAWHGAVAPIEDWPGLNNSCCRLATGGESSDPFSEEIRDKKESLHAYPNPAENMLNLNWEGELAEFEIVDLLGRKVKSGTLQRGNTMESLEFIPCGVYRILVRSKSKVHQIQLSLIK